MDVLKRNNVRVLGDSGPVLLYAHGFGCNQDMWSDVTPAFMDSHRQVVFDYVGSGQADLAAFDAERYSSLDAYAQDILDVCDALGLDEPVTLVGHSVSSSIGLLAAIARPGLVDRLVMVGPSPSFLNHPPDYTGGFEREDLEGLLNLMDQNYIGWAEFLGHAASGVAGGRPEAAPVSRALTKSFCTTDPVTAKTFARATFFADNRDDLPKVPCPSLIIQHRHDALAPLAVGEYMHRHMPGSTLKILDVTGHCAHMSHPGLVVDAMNEYLASTEVADFAPA